MDGTVPCGASVVRVACPGGIRRPIPWERATTTGFFLAKRRTIRENFRGLPKDSKYTPTALVCGSSSRYCIASLPETSALFPALIIDEIPMRRCCAAVKSIAPIGADCENKPIDPCLGSVGDTEAFKLTCGSVLIIPADAGPMTRIPWLRAKIG